MLAAGSARIIHWTERFYQPASQLAVPNFVITTSAQRNQATDPGLFRRCDGKMLHLWDRPTDYFHEHRSGPSCVPDPSGAAIEFDRVSKKFVIHHRRNRSFQDVMINMFRPLGKKEDFWALSDLSFRVFQGETLGIIGENGSGKSTILKLISRILEPTSGKVIIRGRVAALLELGAGFHPDLSGRDNVFLNSSILGLGRRETAERFSEIVDFAELGQFIDTPIKHYSSGMYMRLAFAIATCMEPEILLIDEILAVGDEAFQGKCLNRMYELRSRCKAIVFVSHDLPAVRSLCTRAIWLDKGRIRAEGPPQQVLDQYLARAGERERVQPGKAIDGADG